MNRTNLIRPVTVIGLPFAGATQYSYNPLKEFFPEEIKFFCIDIPGRGSRITEPLLTDILQITDDVFRQIRQHLNPPYAFFGHSMGTLLAYLLTHRILKEGMRPPQHLFLSGRSGPSVPCNTKDYLLPKEEFRARLMELGGVPDQILSNESAMSLFEPILRADFQAVEEYKHRILPILSVPITVMIGKDEETSMSEALIWQKETSQSVAVHEFDGDHFFIFNHRPGIVDIIVKSLGAVPLSVNHQDIFMKRS